MPISPFEMTRKLEPQFGFRLAWEYVEYVSLPDPIKQQEQAEIMFHKLETKFNSNSAKFLANLPFLIAECRKKNGGKMNF